MTLENAHGGGTMTGNILTNSILSNILSNNILSSVFLVGLVDEMGTAALVMSIMSIYGCGVLSVPRGSDGS